ncbi:MAG: ABC transporter permease subunit [Candidatus Caldarchaeum sp.]
MTVKTLSEYSAIKLIRGVSGRRHYIISLLAVAVAWEVASWFLPPYILPSWALVFETLTRLNMIHAWITLGRVLLALTAAFSTGLALATLMYLSREFEKYMMPVVNLIMAVPAICWVLFAILWFRGQELRIFFVLFAVCLPGFVIDLLDAIKNIPSQLREMIISFRPTTMQYIRKLILPAITPNILTTWKVNLGLAIRVVTVAELVGTLTGIGYALNFALGQQSIREITAWTIVLVVSLLALQGVVYMFEKRLLRWRR